MNLEKQNISLNDGLACAALLLSGTRLPVVLLTMTMGDGCYGDFIVSNLKSDYYALHIHKLNQAE